MSKRNLLFACLLASGNVAAQMEIAILDAQYETDLRTQYQLLVGPPEAPLSKTLEIAETQTRTSDLPIIGAELAPLERTFARATADTFFVSTSTSGLENRRNEADARARAVARTDLTFSPLADGLAPLAFEIALTGVASFSAGSMTLRDLTLDQDMAYYYWRGQIRTTEDIPFGTNIPGLRFAPGQCSCERWSAVIRLP